MGALDRARQRWGTGVEFPVCTECGLKVVSGGSTHHDCARRKADREELFPNQCDSCGAGLPRHERRCTTCPPPPLPREYLDARQRLEAKLGKVGPA